MSVDEEDPFEGITFDESWASSARRSEAAAVRRAPTRFPLDEPPKRGKRRPLKIIGGLLAIAVVGTGLGALVVHDRQTANASSVGTRCKSASRARRPHRPTR